MLHEVPLSSDTVKAWPWNTDLNFACYSKHPSLVQPLCVLDRGASSVLKEVAVLAANLLVLVDVFHD